MLFDVVTCGFEAAPLEALPEAGQVHRLPAPTHPDFAARALETLRDRERERVLVVHEAQPVLTRQVRRVRAMLRDHRVAPVPLRRPRTGLAAQASWLAALAVRDVTPGRALAALADIAAHLPTYAVATSVARLDLPGVRMRHHVLSSVPGTTFGVVLGSEVRVVLGPPEVTVRHPQDKTADLVCAGDPRLAGRLAGVRPHAVAQTLDLTAGRAPGQPAGAGERGGRADRRGWWGSVRHHETTVVPRDVDEFAAGLLERPSPTCPHCGETAAAGCPFCLSHEPRREPGPVAGPDPRGVFA
jgi:hypothetical protein